MLSVAVENDAVRIGPYWAVTFHRTLRVPDDGHVYPLPPGLGKLPVFRVADFKARLPVSLRREGGVFIPMYQREALWLGFHGPDWRAQAVTVAVGGINALTGGPAAAPLTSDPQNYIVCPDQPWLDGINTGHGFVRQFVAMPLGQGYTVEGDLTGSEIRGGFQLTVYEPHPGRFSETPPQRDPTPLDTDREGPPRPMAAPVMGLGAGGRLRQKIYADPHGLDTWDAARLGHLRVHLLNSRQFAEVTGRPPPPSPIDAATYAACGLPWFTRYDDSQADIEPSERLSGVKTIAARDAERAAAGPRPAPPGIERQEVRNNGGRKH